MNKGIDIRKVRASAARTDASTGKSSPSGGRSASLGDFLNRDMTLFSAFGDKQKETFYHELGILLQAGIDLKGAFDMVIGEQRNRKNTAMLTAIQTDVVAGSSLSVAMQQHRTFTPYEYHSLRIGEETGGIAPVLQDLALFFRKRLRQRRQLSGALTYPAIVMLTSFGAIFFMMNFIVPMFADIFQRSGGQLPPITQLIVTASDFSRKYALLLILGMLAIGLWLYVRRNSPLHRQWTAWILLRLPVFGGIIRKVYLARFCNSMALLTGAKIPLNRALELCREMVGFQPIERSLAVVEDRVMHGHSLHASLAEFAIYDAKLVSLVKVGEEVNQLADFFGKVADQYNEEVEYRSATISALLEPIIIVFLGLFVGLILIAMYLPMFQMGDVVG